MTNWLSLTALDDYHLTMKCADSVKINQTLSNSDLISHLQLSTPDSKATSKK